MHRKLERLSGYFWKSSSEKVHQKFIEQVLPGARLRLPCDIKITNGGYRIERIGASLEEDRGRRIFIVGTKDLENFYKEDHHSAEDLYMFLREYRVNGKRLGKHLALSNEPVDIDPVEMSNYKIIIKLIEHETDKRWNAIDLARFDFSPEKGLTEEVVERLIYLYGDKPLNLSKVTKNAPLHIVEPYRSTLRQRDIDFINENMETKFEEILDNHDRQMFTSNINTLIIPSLRSKVGDYEPPVPLLDVYIFQKNGLLFARIMHTEDDLNKKTYGINSIEVNEKKYFLSDQQFIEIPIEVGTFSLYYNSGSPVERLGLKFNISLNKRGELMANYISGIKEIPVEQYNPSAGIITKQNKGELEEVKLEQERNKMAEEKQEKLNKSKKIGTNVILFE